jgi:hypothetical protein
MNLMAVYVEIQWHPRPHRNPHPHMDLSGYIYPPVEILSVYNFLDWLTRGGFS